ncbi:hypothetical protein [Arthrobacter sp. CJ23]|nr:hypothetical protein [Arthrobacter sp. CJ23]UVJ39853.1 hypothetical protein NVV90_01260 [Arthrobacter sp. CJ23]
METMTAPAMRRQHRIAPAGWEEPLSSGVAGTSSPLNSVDAGDIK